MSRPNKVMFELTSPSVPLRRPPTVTFASEGCVMAHWQNVAVAVWGSESSLAQVDHLRNLLTRTTAEHPRISAVHIALGAFPLPSKEVRAAFGSLTNDFGARIDQTALLLGDAGFWASAVRSFVTSYVLNKQPVRVNLCGSLEEIAKKMGQSHVVRPGGPLVDAAELHEALVWVVDRPELRAGRSNVA